MSQAVVKEHVVTDKSNLDSTQFEDRLREAFRLVRRRKAPKKKNGGACQVVQDGAEDLKKAVNDRLSTSQR